MELTMTNNFGFCELNENEMMMVDGGSEPTNNDGIWGVIDHAVYGMSGNKYNLNEVAQRGGNAVRNGAKAWCNYWNNVGWNIYEATH